MSHSFADLSLLYLHIYYILLLIKLYYNPGNPTNWENVGEMLVQENNQEHYVYWQAATWNGM